MDDNLTPQFESDFDYFYKRGPKENVKFWSRLGEGHLVKGAKVLDVGCGHGSLAIDSALKGAREVHGIDLDKKRINFAKNNLVEKYPNLKDRVFFHEIDLKDFSEDNFDLILSKDTFEHVDDPQRILDLMKSRLKPGGKILLGFGALYNSFYGDHKRTHAIIPWGHLMVPDKWLIYNLRKRHGLNVNRIQDLGLNCLSCKDFKRIIFNSGLDVQKFYVNRSNNPILWVVAQLAKIPFLSELFSHNIYCVLMKKK